MMFYCQYLYWGNWISYLMFCPGVLVFLKQSQLHEMFSHKEVSKISARSSDSNNRYSIQNYLYWYLSLFVPYFIYCIASIFKAPVRGREQGPGSKHVYGVKVIFLVSLYLDRCLKINTANSNHIWVEYAVIRYQSVNMSYVLTFNI